MLRIIQYSVLTQHKEMVKALIKPERSIIESYMSNEGAVEALHMAVGISGEVGELLENIFECLGRENLVEELGDIEFYMRGLVNALGLNSYLNSHLKVNPIRGSSLERAAVYASIKASALLDVIKKHAIYEQPVDIEKAQRAFDGLLYSLECIRTEAKVTRQECLEANIAKLSKRYSGGTYTNQDAQFRADKINGE